MTAPKKLTEAELDDLVDYCDVKVGALLWRNEYAEARLEAAEGLLREVDACADVFGVMPHVRAFLSEDK